MPWSIKKAKRSKEKRGEEGGGRREMKSGWSIATLKKDLPLPGNICNDRWLFHGIVCAKDLSKTNEQRSFIIGRGSVQEQRE